MNKVTLSLYVQVFVWLFLFLLGKYLEVELLHDVKCMLNLFKN